MKINIKKKENGMRFSLIGKSLFIVAMLFIGLTNSVAQDAANQAATTENAEQARVTGLNYICVHVLDLEKTLVLYREILGFKLNDAEVYHGPNLEGMLVLKMKANDVTIHLSVTAPEFIETVGPIGNTNHNHFMLRVNDIKTIGDKLVEQGYKLENENYARDKYTFFVGPNGEIVGLSAWD